MTPQAAFNEWRADFADRSRSVACQWTRLTEALALLVLRNSQGVHGRVVLARLNDLEAIVSELRTTLRGGGTEDAARAGNAGRADLLWSHLRPEIAFQKGTRSDHFQHVDRQQLEETIERYRRSPWLANDALEWMMVDAATYRDVVAFGEFIKRNVKGVNEALRASGNGGRARRLTWRTVGVLGELSVFVAAPIAAAALAPHFIADRIVLWVSPIALACLIAYLIFVVVRFLRQEREKQSARKALAQWSAMCAAYALLDRPAASLSRIETALRNAASRGAQWTRSTFALLAFAKARGVEAWRL